jgi:hypothetical protein
VKNDKGETMQFILSIDLGEAVDNEGLDQASRELRAELMEMDLDSVEFVRAGEMQAGTKSAEALTIGTLTVTLLPALLPKLLEYLQSWSLRAENRKVTVKTQFGDRSIELEYTPSALSPEELDRLVNTLTGALKTQPRTGTKK